MSESLDDSPEWRRSMMRGVLGRAGAQASASANDASDGVESSSSEEEISQQPRGRKRKADELSENEDQNGDTDSSSEEAVGPSTRKKNKGKEREHTPEENDTQPENVGNPFESSEEASDEEVEEGEDEQVVGLEEEDVDDDDDGPVYHHAIWNRLVNLAASSGSYTHTPAHGNEHEDVTAFHPASASWGKLRVDRPPVSSLWMPPTPANNPNYGIKDLKYNDRTVLDWEGEPIRAFEELPLTIASTVEGWRIEAWIRNDNRVIYRDIVARMRTRPAANGRVPIYGTRALASRASNFRDHAGSVSWKIMARQARSRAYMNQLRTPAQRANNLTTDKDLTGAQRAAYYSISRSRAFQGTTTGTARTSAPRVGVAGSSNAGPSSLRRAAVNLRSAAPSTPGPSIPVRRSQRRRTARHYSSEIEDHEQSIHEQNGSDKGEALLDIDEGEEEALIDTNQTDEDEEVDTSLIDADNISSEQDSHSAFESSNSEMEDSDFGEGEEEARLDTNPISEDEKEAEMPHSFFLDERREQVGDCNSDTDASSDSEDNDSASERSIGSEPEDPNDARNLLPDDLEEAIVLRAALDATREDFRRLTGQNPTKIDPMQNYFSQWAAYQTQLSAMFQAQGRVEDRTILFGLEGWVGGIPNWETARPARNDRTFEDGEM